MDLTTFFEKFDQCADVPNAVVKLRELVLELAVRGRLSERRPKDQDEPAWRAFLGEFDSRIYESDPGPPPPFEIPEEWRWVCVDDAAEAGEQKKPDALFTYIDVGSIDNSRGVIRSELEVIEPASAPSRARKLVRPGAVIYATVRPYLKNIAVVDREFSPPAIVSTAFAILHPRDFAEARFLFYWLRSESFAAVVAGRMKGVAYPAINDGEFRGCPVPLPPLPEQKRIVAKVDELMALCDRLAAQQQQWETRQAALARASLARFAAAPTPANLNLLFHSSFSIPPSDLRKSILTLAVQGKLVPQDPNDEPAAETIRRIPPLPRPARFDKRSVAKIQGIAALSVGPTTREIPGGWSCVPLIQIARLESGHTPSRSRPDWWGGDVSWIGVVDARIHNGKIIYETLQHTNAQGLANSAARLLPAGTVCVSRTASVGYVTIMGKPMATSQDFVNWVPSNAVTSAWLQLVFTAEKDAFERFSKGAVHQTIYFPEWLSMHAMIPPLAEQRRIVAKVEQMMVLVDALEQQLVASGATAEKLLTALIAELTSATTQKTRVLMAAEDPGHYDATVKVPSLSTGLAFARATLAAEIVHRMHGDRTFGQIKFQKALYLTEYIAQLDQIESHPRRFQNGPHDPELIAQVETKMKECEWFEAVPRTGGHGHEYHALSKAGGHKAHFDHLWPKQAAVIRRLIDEMKTWKTERCERFATLYAAWNDLIIWGKSANDAAILDQVLNHWHSAKQQIHKSSWQDMLTWMRREGYVPIGWGRVTSIAPQSELF